MRAAQEITVERESKSLRLVMTEFDISGQDLSKVSGVPAQKISEFRSGKEISRLNYVKIVSGLFAINPEAGRSYLNRVFGYSDPKPNKLLKKRVLDAVSFLYKVRDCINRLGVNQSDLERQLLIMNHNGVADMTKERLAEILVGNTNGLTDDEVRIIRLLVDPEEKFYSEQQWEESVVWQQKSPTDEQQGNGLTNGVR